MENPIDVASVSSDPTPISAVELQQELARLREALATIDMVTQSMTEQMNSAVAELVTQHEEALRALEARIAAGVCA